MNITASITTKRDGQYDLVTGVDVHVVEGILPVPVLEAIAREEVIGYTACEPEDFTLTTTSPTRPTEAEIYADFANVVKLSEFHNHNKTTFTVNWKDA